MMALNTFSNADSIYIAGFDKNTGKEGKGHYFEKDFLDKDMPDDPVGHDWESENTFIDKLIDSNKLTRFD